MPAVQRRPELDPRLRARLDDAAIQTIGSGSKFFAGQRADGFYVDLGSIFDLGELRLRSRNLAAQGLRPCAGMNSLAA